MKVEKEHKLLFFQELFDKAKSAMTEVYDGMTRNIAQYKGSRDIDSDAGDAVRALYVRNITYELIESQVSGHIPSPSVQPQTWSDANGRRAKSIETMAKNNRDRIQFEEMNDIDERHCMIYGGSVWFVEWDESILTHNTVGDVKVTCIPPNRFFGQPHIYDVESMEYCFITFETTKEDIARKYDVKDQILVDTETEEGDGDETATLCVCFYKDDDGNVCEYIWSGDVELRDVDDYYAHKYTVCKVCGKRKELCTCEEDGNKPKYEVISEEYEVLDHDVLLSDGTIIPAMSPVVENGVIKTEVVMRNVVDASGNIVLDDVGGMLMPREAQVEVPVMEPTKIPYYKPKTLPIVIRKNTSAEKKLFGQSDCEVIRHQQQASNKIESRIMEKLLKGGMFPILPDDADVELDNSVWDVALRATPENYSRFGRLDLSADISRDVAMADRIYDQAKRILGISDSYQGQHDSSAQSGVAKQLQIQQSAGRLNSKRQLKNAAYSKIDRIMFEFMLAYADEPRPASYVDAYGRTQNIAFNRYDFLDQDDELKYYYDDQYLFSADTSTDAENDRAFVWQENLKHFQMGAYGDPALPQTQLVYWLNMERAHYPYAHDNVVRIQEEIKRIQMEQAMLAQQAQTQPIYDNYASFLTGAERNTNAGL